jgi:CheY-like chemotaxis protein
MLEFGLPHEDRQQKITEPVLKKAWPQLELSILVVEDDAINQILLCETLLKHNYQINAAYDGKEALELLQKNKYDLIFMDVQMREMDGFQTTKLIRGDDNNLNRQTPIIFTTGYSGEREQNIMKELGGHILYKPLDIYNVCSIMNEIFSAEMSPK